MNTAVIKQLFERNNPIVLIPSCGRAESFTTKGILSPFPRERIFVFVEQDEVPEYKQHEEWARVVVLPEKWQGVTSSRQFALSYARGVGARWAFMLDDDYEALVRRSEFLEERKYWKLEPIGESSLWVVYAEMLAVALHKQAAQVGLSYRQSNWQYNGALKLCAKANNFSLLDLSSDLVTYDLAIKAFQDFDLTLNILTGGGLTACWYGSAFGMAPMCKKAGGWQMARFDRRTATQEALARLVGKYGSEFVKPVDRGHGFQEPSVNWRKLCKGKIKASR